MIASSAPDGACHRAGQGPDPFGRPGWTKREHIFVAPGLLRGACHRARIRATRWLAMMGRGRWRPHPVIARRSCAEAIQSFCVRCTEEAAFDQCPRHLFLFSARWGSHMETGGGRDPLLPSPGGVSTDLTRTCAAKTRVFPMLSVPRWIWTHPLSMRRPRVRSWRLPEIGIVHRLHPHDGVAHRRDVGREVVQRDAIDQ